MAGNALRLVISISASALMYTSKNSGPQNGNSGLYVDVCRYCPSYAPGDGGQQHMSGNLPGASAQKRMLPISLAAVVLRAAYRMPKILSIHRNWGRSRKEGRSSVSATFLPHRCSTLT